MMALRAGRIESEINASKIDDVEVDGGEVGNNEVGKKVRKTSKSKKTVGSDFFISRARLAFTELRQAFVKASILHYFDLERHIQIETNVLGYAISRVFS